jgi:hypothetical protein
LSYITEEKNWGEYTGSPQTHKRVQSLFWAPCGFDSLNHIKGGWLWKMSFSFLVFHGLSVYGASKPELTTIQKILDRCAERRYISTKLNIHELQ